jgi:hypothetical protein
MHKQWHEENYRLAGVMLAVAAINGWLAYEFGLKHPIMAFLHGVMAVTMILAVVFLSQLVLRNKNKLTYTSR